MGEISHDSGCIRHDSCYSIGGRSKDVGNLKVRVPNA
jgi:hypothetical protein